MQKSSIVVLVLVVVFAASAAFGAGDDGVPSWLQQAASIPTPAYEIKDVPAVVLRNEEIVTVGADGTVVRTVRRAVRLLLREGRGEAIARVVYQTDSDKVRDLSAWLIRRSGPVKSYGKKEAIDMVLEDNDLYNEARKRFINASDDADAGDVFGYETTLEERSVFSQFMFLFQDDLPTLNSRFSLTLPAGWKAESHTFNRPKVEPIVSGSSYTWELQGLQPIKPEAGSPGWAGLSPRLAVSYFPASATLGQIKTFANWNDVARWMSELGDPQMTVGDALAAKAQDLTAGAKTELDKIRAIAKYVQGLQYISIQIGTGRGGGYTPRPATEVFAKSYGDCKGKANLMRAMLSVLKIEAYLVSITADDPDFVRVEWASPHQFNHCIIAVRIKDETQAPSVVTHPKLGRLLIFDATDPYTQVGDLPEEEQGSYALINHRETDDLIRMPVIPAELNRLERNLEVTLSPEGAIMGRVTEQTIGQRAVGERSLKRRLSAPDYNRTIENWIARGATGAKATKISPNDDHAEGRFTLDVDFSADSYAQIMQNRLMVFKPAIIGRLDRLSFTEGKRQNPFVIDAEMYQETVKIKLPSGFIVDEIPESTTLTTPFGTYDAKFEVAGETLLVTRSLKLNRATVPADKYFSVRDFFGKIHAAEQSPVVLMRK